MITSTSLRRMSVEKFLTAVMPPGKVLQTSLTVMM